MMFFRKWQSEKEIVDAIQQAKTAIEGYKTDAERAERNGEYGKVAELRYGKIKGCSGGNSKNYNNS